MKEIEKPSNTKDINTSEIEESKEDVNYHNQVIYYSLYILIQIELSYNINSKGLTMRGILINPA